MFRRTLFCALACYLVFGLLLGPSTAVAQGMFDERRIVPTEEGFKEFIQDIRESSTSTFEAVKGKHRVDQRVPTWGLRPIPGCPPDWEGMRHSLKVQWGDLRGEVMLQEVARN